ncbi:MAG: DUF6064 family protein [Calditrichia bacterium]
MNIPFTIEQFLSVFEKYNLTIWPMQIVLYLLALVAIFLTLKPRKAAGRIISLILAIFWLWMGIVYHLLFFTAINPAAYIFAMLYIVQAILFLVAGIIKTNLSFKFQANLYGLTGALFLIYALLVYPLLGYAFGHAYPAMPTFGAPCPTTIFTFGILLLTVKRVPKYLLVIPFLWSLLGFSAAVNLMIKEDFGLLAAGILGTALIIMKDRKGTGKEPVISRNL